MVKRDLYRYIGILVALIVGFVALNIWVFDSVKIDRSMANNYLKTGNRFVVNKMASIRKGDFVLYEAQGEQHVGRVIASQGDSVRYMDNILYLNDHASHEDYLPVGTVTDDFTIDRLPHATDETVGSDQFLIINDKRTNQADSRTYGLISRSAIVGRLTFRISPLHKLGFIETGLEETD